ADVIPFQEKNIENNDSPARSPAPYRIYNIGHGSPVNLMSFIQEIEKATNKVATKHFREMQPGDVYQTYADTQDLFDVINYTPKVSITEGVPKFVDWFKYHYQHKDNSKISTNNNDTNGRVNSIESMLLQS
ncbi:protein CapI, partial [Aliivibrio sifiae]